MNAAPAPAQLSDRFRHIVIEGPIGVGKSSLARRLAEQLGAELLLEKADDNPFLERFYDDRFGYAFQTQLFFLFQRVKQMQTLSQQGMFSRGVVSDFLFAKDALFARLNLSDEEYRLYAQMYAQVAPSVPEPDLIVWLQATPATLLQRIQQRGIAMEQGIGEEYLQRLCDAYVEHFHSHAGAPVFGVVTERFNPVDNNADFDLLLDKLSTFEGRRGIYDPAA
ncbi:MAG: deoxynucleoside kinase [Betaproteobacteria bacterium]|nr:MAG: deoxynucleoside kinase [Betaproteobacteria bacterium]